ncbi:MAG: hypothetical protein GX238_11750 [Epulopiscium sp.]|nr:hypothetical protein [Candidatus Epulonipiscium sp.]
MTVYKYFIKIGLKNKWAVFSYTIIFFILAIINGSSGAEREASFNETKLNIGITDNSHSDLSKGLKDYLGKKQSDYYYF